jgi:hypothetical protein
MTWALFPGDKYTRAALEIVTTASQHGPGAERVVAVLGGALLEEAVDKTLRERLQNIPLADGLLSIDGALGNMGPKTDLLYLLRAFDSNTLKTLKGIAGVRNFFAHHLDASFDSLNKDFVNSIGKLVLHEGRTHYPHHLFGPDSQTPIEPVSSRRDLFILNLKLALIMLMRDRVSHEPWTNRQLTEEELLANYPDRWER